MLGSMSASSAAPRVGFDLVDVERFRGALSRHGDAFRRRVFTEREWAHAAARADRDVALAARFAAKEAVMKALETGWGRGVSWQEVEVEGGSRGAPRVRLHGRAAAIAADLGVRVDVSLSHDGPTAGAVALASRA
jgi:holo-[acyl-carrier protein] synthase